MIETRKLRKEFGGDVALEALDLRVRPGEIVGLLGANGAGKSTALKMLATLLKPTAGTARVAGFDVVADAMEVRRRIGYIPESGAVFEELSGFEYLDMTVDLKGLPHASGQRSALELLDAFGLRDAAHDLLRDYSKGMRKKVLVIAALLGRPDVLLLDEPFDGLDVSANSLVKRVLQELSAQSGVAVLLSSHMLDSVERVCDRVCVLSDGTTQAHGTPAELVRDAAATDLEGAFARLTGEAEAEATATVHRILRSIEG